MHSCSLQVALDDSSVHDDSPRVRIQNAVQSCRKRLAPRAHDPIELDMPNIPGYAQIPKHCREVAVDVARNGSLPGTRCRRRFIEGEVYGLFACAALGTSNVAQAMMATKPPSTRRTFDLVISIASSNPLKPVGFPCE